MNFSKLYRSIYLILPLLCFGLASCDLISPKAEDPNVLGGETDIELSKPGTKYYSYFTLNGTNLDLQDTIVITKRDDGIVTLHVFVGTAGMPAAALIPTEFKDSKGNFNADIKYKVTSEGIQDFLYSDQNTSKPFTLVKYDDGVGAKYEFTSKNGKKVTREITEKTGKDDWPFGMMYIKTSKIEETPDLGGVAKITYRTNHKFGLVFIEFLLNDGSVIRVGLVTGANV